MRSRHVILVVFSAVAWLALPANAFSQERKGFWFGIGGGYGSAGISCADCDNEKREGSGVALLEGGWTLNPHTRVGLEFNYWSKDDTSDPDFRATLNLYNFSGAVTYFPQPTSGFFVKGGAGVAIIDVDLSGSGSSATLDLGKGFGFVVGAGYDIPVWRRVSVTPAVNFWYGQPGDLKIFGTTFSSNWKQNVIDFTIGITVP